MVNEGPPAGTEPGVTLVMVSFGLLMSSGRGGGEVVLVAATSMEAVPAFAMRLAGTWAINCVLEIKVVLRGLPLKVTVNAGVNPVPFAVRVNEGPPGATLAGEIDVRVTGTRATLNGRALETVVPF